MALSEKSQACFDLVCSSAETIKEDRCGTTSEKLLALLAETGTRKSLGAVTAFNKTGVYTLEIFPGDIDHGRSSMAQAWQHTLTVVCIDSEATLYQSWVNNYSLDEWLHVTAAGADQRTCATAFSPGSANFQAHPSTSMATWLQALPRFKANWDASAVSGDATQTRASCKLLFGCDLGKLYPAVSSYPLNLTWKRYAFTESAAGKLGLATEEEVLVPALATMGGRKSSKGKCNIL